MASFGTAVAAANAMVQSARFAEGLYTLEVKRLTFGKKRKGNMFIAELAVTSATKTVPAVEPNAVGTVVGYIVNTDDVNGLGVGNVKSFFAALVGCSISEVTADDVDAAINDDPKQGAVNPLAGLQIKCEAFDRPTQAGKPFTRTRWEHVRGQ